MSVILEILRKNGAGQSSFGPPRPNQNQSQLLFIYLVYLKHIIIPFFFLLVYKVGSRINFFAVCCTALQQLLMLVVIG